MFQNYSVFLIFLKQKMSDCAFDVLHRREFLRYESRDRMQVFTFHYQK